jgi:acyl dehydratase
MRVIRKLNRTPRLSVLYARTAAAAIPGAGRLPMLPGGGGRVPELQLQLTGVRADTPTLAAYRSLCGFAAGEDLPGTYPHVLAFPLHMSLMAGPRFPCAPAGLVHIENSICQHRRIGAAETLELRVHAGALRPHPRGRTFTLTTQAIAAGEMVWQGSSTMLQRARTREMGDGRPPAVATARPQAADGEQEHSQVWDLPGDLGRRYGAISGDRNPIHLHPLAARALGFPGAIAHGMWTKARVLAAVQDELPDAYAIDVSFHRPIVLPASVRFAARSNQQELELAVRSAKHHRTHLRGRIHPLDMQPGRTIRTGDQAT